MSGLTLDQAEAIGRAVQKAAMENDFALAVAIVDLSGWPILQFRMEGAFPAAIDAALAKARTAALYRRSSSEFSKRVKQGLPLGFLPHVVPLGGGVLLERDGMLLGALGLSGAQEESETEIAEQIAAEFPRTVSCI